MDSVFKPKLLLLNMSLTCIMQVSGPISVQIKCASTVTELCGLPKHRRPAAAGLLMCRHGVLLSSHLVIHLETFLFKAGVYIRIPKSLIKQRINVDPTGPKHEFSYTP